MPLLARSPQLPAPQLAAIRKEKSTRLGVMTRAPAPMSSPRLLLRKQQTEKVTVGESAQQSSALMQVKGHALRWSKVMASAGFKDCWQSPWGCIPVVHY